MKLIGKLRDYFFTDKNMGSTIFLGGLLTVITIILWIQNQDLADIYHWYFTLK